MVTLYPLKSRETVQVQVKPLEITKTYSHYKICNFSWHHLIQLLHIGNFVEYYLLAAKLYLAFSAGATTL